jgi:hypothetical protein
MPGIPPMMANTQAESATSIPQGLKPGVILLFLRHDSSRALTLLAAGDQFLDSL